MGDTKLIYNQAFIKTLLLKVSYFIKHWVFLGIVLKVVGYN